MQPVTVYSATLAHLDMTCTCGIPLNFIVLVVVVLQQPLRAAIVMLLCEPKNPLLVSGGRLRSDWSLWLAVCVAVYVT